MPKTKMFLKDMKDSKKKGKRAPAAPETADEYLEAGVDYEEAGEKWRGGDAVKSTRFFVRAIECYQEALKKFPDSFDLAYNKARVEYELTQYPKLLDQLPNPLLQVLDTALTSSRYAMKLKPDNADVLFNTAQILTSIVEALTEDPSNETNPFPSLEEALELFQKCLALQENQLTESNAQQEAMAVEPIPQVDADTEDGGAPISGSPAPEEERWASVVEPVTHDTLLDTVLAQLACLTTLNSLMPESGDLLTFVEEYSSSLLNTKLPTYLSGTERGPEAGLIRANFIAGFAEANFRCRRIDVPAYLHALTEAFSPLDLSTNPEGLVNKAEALLAYNISVIHLYEQPAADYLDTRWKALTEALACLTAASKLPTADNLPKIHLRRGNVELARFQLGIQGYGAAVKHSAILVKNAEKFYRGAGALAKNAGEEDDVLEATIKEALAIALGGDTHQLRDLSKGKGVREVLQDAVEDYLITYEQLSEMGV